MFLEIGASLLKELWKGGDSKRPNRLSVVRFCVKGLSNRI